MKEFGNIFNNEEESLKVSGFLTYSCICGGLPRLIHLLSQRDCLLLEQRITLDKLKHIMLYAFLDHLTMKDTGNIIINEEENQKVQGFSLMNVLVAACHD